MWPVIREGLGLVTPLATLLTVVFLLYPELKGLGPALERSVQITDAAFVEQRIGADQVVSNVVAVEVEAKGYDDGEQPVALEWMTLDPLTRRRLDTPVRWGTIDFDTRSDRITALVSTEAPMEYPECVIVRVVAVPDRGGDEADAAGLEGTHVLDLADTAPFDPDDPGNPACLGIPAPSATAVDR